MYIYSLFSLFGNIYEISNKLSRVVYLYFSLYVFYVPCSFHTITCYLVSSILELKKKILNLHTEIKLERSHELFKKKM